jgi:aspartyl protease family protein
VSAARTVRRMVAAAAGVLAVTAAHATTVMVMSLDHDRAQLLVNGSAVRSLRSGQSSPEGVRLISADRTQAVVEVDGKPLTLRLGQSTVAVAELKADPRGQFLVAAYVNGVETRALIDTGATSVALSSDEAQRLGVGYAGRAPVQIATAGGPKTAYRVTLASVRVGGVTLHNVDAVVLEGGREQLPITLIGMSFLNSVDMRRVGDTLLLTRRNF